jgi:hypothetical protein
VRTETFFVEGGVLACAVVPDPGKGGGGRPYIHRCPLSALEAVAHAIDEAPASGITQPEVKAATGLPWTQVDVALALLRERGCIERGYRRRYRPTGGDTHLDALIEYHALRDGSANDGGKP